MPLFLAYKFPLQESPLTMRPFRSGSLSSKKALMLVSCLAGVGSAMLLLYPDKALGRTSVKHTAKHAPKSSTAFAAKPVAAPHRRLSPKDVTSSKDEVGSGPIDSITEI